MAWSELDIICNKHPDHRQQPGVCSCCLREKLGKLSLYPPPSQMIRTVVAVSSLSANSSYTSASSSTCTSPVHSRHRRHSSTGGSVGFLITSTGGGLKKSRSIAFVTASGGVEDDVKHKKGRSGFWKKLIRTTGKGTKNVFMHSRTVKERSDVQF